MTGGETRYRKHGRNGDVRGGTESNGKTEGEIIMNESEWNKTVAFTAYC